MIKKLILLGFGLALLVGLPLTLFVLQNQSQTTTKSSAAQATIFSFSGPSTVTNGQQFDEGITVDPRNQNEVSFVKFTFTYDQTKLDKTAEATIDTSKFTALEGPTTTCANSICTVTGTLSIGATANAVIKSATVVATAHLVAKADTDSNGTQLAFVSGQNQALSVGSSDQAAENVFQTGTPTTIVISDQSPNPSGTVTSAPPNPTGTVVSAPPNTNTGGATASNSLVTCNSFTADNTSGNAPLVATFTTTGSSTTDTISQLVISYGDGSSDTVATGSGIGSNAITNQISHTYTANGTFTATATLTSAGGATSSPNTCKQTITVGVVAAAKNQLPATGPGETIMLFGAVGALFTFGGFALLVGF